MNASDKSFLIFDMDGLLIDSEPLWWQAEHALAKAYGCSWSDELARSCLGTGLPNAIATMQREVGLPVAVDEGVAWLLEFFSDHVGRLRLKPGCREILENSHRYTRAVASSSPLHLIERVVQQFEIGSYFADLVSGEMVQNPKPAPDIFLHSCQRQGFTAAQSVVLEDSVAGCQAGVAAGASVIAIPEYEQEYPRYHAVTPYVVGDLFEAGALLGMTFDSSN